MAECGPEELRATFGEDAELYDRCRRGCPSAAFGELRALADIGPRIARPRGRLQNGPGDRPLARRGRRPASRHRGRRIRPVRSKGVPPARLGGDLLHGRVPQPTLHVLQKSRFRRRRSCSVAN